MFSVIELNTSKVNKLGVGFYTIELPSNYHVCMAFIVRDDQGFFSAEDIQAGIFDSGLISTPDYVEGLSHILISQLNQDGSVNHTLVDDVKYFHNPPLSNLFTINEEKRKKHFELFNNDVNHIFKLSEEERFSNNEGIDDADTSHIKTLFEESEKLLEMKTNVRERFNI